MKSVAVYYTYKVNSDSSNKDEDLKQIDLWCRKRNYNYTLYIDEVLNRNDNENRLSMKELKRDIQRNYYSSVIIFNMHNLSRDFLFCTNFINFARNYNCKVLSVDGVNLYSYTDFVEKLSKALYKKNKEKVKKLKEEKER